MQSSRRFRLIPGLVVALVAAVILAAGCGGGESTTTSTAVTSTTTASDGGAAAAEAAAAYYDASTFASPPTSGPAPTPGKNVWVVDTTLETAEGATFAEGTKRAARTLGWNVTVFDGQFSPDRWLSGIRQAITDKADGILLYAIDCAPVRAALEEADAAGIAVVGVESADCSVTDAGGPQLFDGTIEYAQGDLEAWEKGLGAAQAAWLADVTGGKAKVVELYETDLWVTRMNHQGFVAELERICPACEIVETVEFVGSDYGPRLQEKTAQALLQHPDADGLVAPYDGVFLGGVAAAVRSSGRTDEIHAIGGVGESAAIDLIRENGGLDAGFGIPIAWEAYAAMDILNRLFEGEEPVPSGIGIGLYDRERGLPESGSWQPPIDYVAAYEQAWGGR